MLLIPKTVGAKLNCYGTYHAEKQKQQTQPNLTSAQGRETDSLSAHTFSLYAIPLLPSPVAQEIKAQLSEPPEVSQESNTLLIQANWMALQVTPQE